ncbi:MAG: sodium-dependent transporter [Clostridia bacterium]|nr:sodium-dependent transporter [Clostridia bacterium]
MSTPTKERSNLTGKLGFVLAAAGSAVGLGNIWRFPYLAAEYGGGIFLLVYLVLAVTFGFALMCAEIAIGRKTGLSAIDAFGKLAKKFSFVGYLAAIVPVIILPYYCVIGGWVVKYFAAFATGSAHEAAASDFFGNFVAKPVEPLVWFSIFLGLTALVVLFGVQKGIEKVSKIMMPVLVILSVVIAVYGCFMPGALDGIKYYLLPDFSAFSIKTVLAAMGQLFYSMSLAMGIMITYGSYMKKDVSLESSVRNIEIFDTGIAFVAGLMVIPSVFSAASTGGGSVEDMLVSGPSLMFVTLPHVFDSMPGGAIIGALFFLLVIFAALTSSISLFETVVSIINDKFHLSRKLCCAITLVISVLLGVPSSLGNGLWASIQLLGMDFLTFFDFISNSVLMPLVALLTCVFVGYILKPKALIEEIELTGRFRSKGLFTVMIKYVAPIFIVLILVSSVLNQFGIIKL